MILMCVTANVAFSVLISMCRGHVFSAVRTRLGMRCFRLFVSAEGMISVFISAFLAKAVFIGMCGGYGLPADGAGPGMLRFRLFVCAERMLLMFMVAGCAFAVFIGMHGFILALRGMIAGGGVPMLFFVVRPLRGKGMGVSRRGVAASRTAATAARKGQAKAEGEQDGDPCSKGVFHDIFLLFIFFAGKKIRTPQSEAPASSIPELLRHNFL